MNDFAKIVQSLRKSCILIGGATEAVSQKDGFLGAMMTPMVAPIDSNYGVFIDTNHDFFSGKRYYWKKVTTEGKGYNNIYHMNPNF